AAGVKSGGLWPGRESVMVLSMSEDWRNFRMNSYLGTVNPTERLEVARFLGTGPMQASERLLMLRPGMAVTFHKSSLPPFLNYVSVLAGTSEDFPGDVWSIRKELLQRAIALDLGLPG